MIKQREQEAIAVYNKILRNKGASPDALKRRELILEKLVLLLADLPCGSDVYREVVEGLLVAMDIAEWPFFLMVIREYFSFWTEDIKAVSVFNKDAEYDFEPVMFPPLHSDLKTMWAQLDNEKFSTVEQWPLKTYSTALRQEGADKTMVEIRIKLAKLLMYRLRSAAVLNNQYYRLAVDSTLHIFKAREMRSLFLSVVREFYYFWIGDPEAIIYIRINRFNTDI